MELCFRGTVAGQAVSIPVPRSTALEVGRKLIAQQAAAAANFKGCSRVQFSAVAVRALPGTVKIESLGTNATSIASVAAGMLHWRQLGKGETAQVRVGDQIALDPRKLASNRRGHNTGSVVIQGGRT